MADYLEFAEIANIDDLENDLNIELIGNTDFSLISKDEPKQFRVIESAGSNDNNKDEYDVTLNDTNSNSSITFEVTDCTDMASESELTQSGDDEHHLRKLFACRHCGKTYRWKSTLRRHETVECGGKAPSYSCPYCDYKAKQRGNLGVHVRKHHPDMPELATRRKSSKV